MNQEGLNDKVKQAADLVASEQTTNPHEMVVSKKAMFSLRSNMVSFLGDVEKDLEFIRRSAPLHEGDAVMLFYFSGRKVELLQKQQQMMELIGSLSRIINQLEK